MSDQADEELDKEMELLVLHDLDRCDDNCPYCYNNMTDEEKKQHNEAMKHPPPF
jgi:hypothetical protein